MDGSADTEQWEARVAGKFSQQVGAQHPASSGREVTSLQNENEHKQLEKHGTRTVVPFCARSATHVE